MILLNQAKIKISAGSKNQTTRAEIRVAGKFPNSCKKVKLTTQERSERRRPVPTASIHRC